MRCNDVEQQLPQYLDGALPASQADSLDVHLAGCPACRGELSQLQRSLRALNLAGREPAPNLWDQFQARLAQDATVSRCREIEKLLPQYVDGDLEHPLSAQARNHLLECAACAKLEADLARPLRMLEQVGAAPPSVDLWSSFTARLATTLSCREVEEQLPAMIAGEPSRMTYAVQSHLESCPSCAASLAAFECSLSALSRVARSAPEVDLWPAFAARLQNEPAASRPRAGYRWLAAMGAWLRGPLLQPALGFAVFALVTVAGHLLSQSAATRHSGVELAQRPRSVSPEISANPGLTDPATVTRSSSSPGPVVAQTVVAPPSPRRPSAAPAVRRPHTPVRVPERILTGDELEDNPGSVLPSQPEPAGIRVAFNLPSSEVGGLPASDPLIEPVFTSGSPVDERDGMQAVVQAVELLAGSEDALNSPFDSKANEK